MSCENMVIEEMNWLLEEFPEEN